MKELFTTRSLECTGLAHSVYNDGNVRHYKSIGCDNPQTRKEPFV